MPLIRDRHGHILGEESHGTFIARHEGRIISIKGLSVTVVIVCEQCREPFTYEMTLKLDNTRDGVLA